jgi:hypothetical protein
MPKLRTLSMALAAAILSTGAVLAETKAEDQSYLPPQDLQAQTKEPDLQAAPQAERRLPSTHYKMTHSYAHRHYAHWHGHRGFFPFFPGIFFGLFH